MEKRIKRFHREKSRKKARFTVRTFGLDYVLFRAISGFYRTSRNERKDNLILKIDHFYHLIYAKNFMVENTKEYFTMTDMQNFIFRHLDKSMSKTAIYNRMMVLMKYDYVMIVDKSGFRNFGVRFAFTIKAREFFKNLNQTIEL